MPTKRVPAHLMPVKWLPVLLLGLVALFGNQPMFALDRTSLTFYLQFEDGYTPRVAPANTEIRLKDYILPDMGVFKAMSDDNRRYLEPDDKTPRILEFAPGRRGQGLKVTGNPTRFTVYSYPCVQYVARECFAPKEGTIAFWMKPVGWSGKDRKMARYFLAVTADNCTMRFYIYISGATAVWLDAKKDFQVVDAGKWDDWKDGEWAFMAFTYKPGQQRVYMNGQFKSQLTDKLVEPEFTSKGMIEISEGDHVLDELMIFNRPLTAVEIASLYRANAPNKVH